MHAQDKAYFEVTIVHPGTFAVGLATKETPLDSVLSQVLARVRVRVRVRVRIRVRVSYP